MKFIIIFILSLYLISPSFAITKIIRAADKTEIIPINIVTNMKDDPANESVYEGFYPFKCCGHLYSDQFISPFTQSSFEIARQNLSVKINNSQSGKNLLFSLGLPEGVDIGFSMAARNELQKIINVDISEVDFYEPKDLDKIVKWRQWKSDALVKLVDKAIEQSNNKSSLTSIILESASLDTKWDTQIKNLLPTSITKSKFIGEIILTGEWERPTNKRLLSIAREALVGTKVKMSVALDLRRNGKAIDPLNQLLNLQGEKIDDIVIEVDDDADLPRAQAFIKDVLPDFQFGLQ